jgi:hypothetical protein
MMQQVVCIVMETPAQAAYYAVTFSSLFVSKVIEELEEGGIQLLATYPLVS